jgi:hypothetical protein
MLFHGFGSRAQKSNSGSMGPRSSTRLAVTSLEVLEDRFLLSKISTGGTAAVGITGERQAQVLVAENFSDTHVLSPASRPTSAGAKMTPGTSAPTEQNEAPASGPPLSNKELPCDLNGSGAGSAPMTTAGTSTPPSLPSFSASAQGSPVSIPSSMPSGIPAAGIFKQTTPYPGSANITVLSADPVAVDFLPISSATLGVASASSAVHGGQTPLLAAQTISAPQSFGSVRPLFGALSRTTTLPVSAPAKVRPAQQRAELPDIAAVLPVTVPDRDSHLQLGSADRGQLKGPRAARPIDAGTLVALAASLIAPVAGDFREAEPTGLENEQMKEQTPTTLAIYSAGSLMIGVSAPGMTSVVRRDKRRPRRLGGDPSRGLIS